MNLLTAVAYDPAAAVAKSCTVNTAMTALDTTNLRLSFTVPAHGFVRVHMHCAIQIGPKFPMILLGVMSGATVIKRVSPLQCPDDPSGDVASATADFVISGLTPGAATWDAAYAVQVHQNSASISYGGPNNATGGSNAWGAFVFEVWDPRPLPLAVPGAAGGVFIAGANAATSVTGALTANITGNLSGSVGSVTARVLANTDQWLGVAVQVPVVPGVPVVDTKYVRGTISPAVPGAVRPDPDNTVSVTAIKAKTDLLPAFLAGTSGGLPTTVNVFTTDGVVDFIEARAGEHVWFGREFYVDGQGGNDTTGNGSRSLPYATITKALSQCVSNRHDVIFLIPNVGFNPNVITEPAGVTINKNFVFIRGPGREVVVNRPGGGTVFVVAADGVEISGLRLVATGANADAINLSTGDFFKITHVWVDASAQDGIFLGGGSNGVIDDCHIVACARDAIRISDTGTPISYLRIRRNLLRAASSSGLRLVGGNIQHTVIQQNVIRDNPTAIFIGVGVDDTILTDNRFGNNFSEVEDHGTRTLDQWNVEVIPVNSLTGEDPTTRKKRNE